MSRATVRSNVQSYFNGALPTMPVVHSSKPRNWDAADFRHATQLSMASAYVYIEESSEQREANGKKSVHYVVSLQLLFRTRHTDVDAAVADLDALIEGIKTRLRLRPPLGQVDTSVIFEAAEHLLEDASDMTVDNPLTQNTRAFVRFDVSEWLTA